MADDFWSTFLGFVSSENSIVLRGILTALLALAAVFGTRLYRRLIMWLRSKMQRFMPVWLHILYDGFSTPLVHLLRWFLTYLALLACPLPVTPRQTAVMAGPFFGAVSIALIGLGFWRSEALCSLLFRSAQNRLDLESNKTMTRFFEKIYRALVVLITVLAILETFGIPVAGLMAGAGVAGLAVSLAAQSTLSNLIAGITLVMERPFGIGDYIVLGSFEGSVEEISFRSTKLRTPDNCLITVENSKVSAEYIQNVTDRQSRLWNFSIGVKYDTSRERIETLCSALDTLFRNDPFVRPDTVQIILLGFGASSIDIEARMYVTALGLADFRAMKNRLNLSIMDVMQQCGCEFAFPSTSVYMENTTAPSP